MDRDAARAAVGQPMSQSKVTRTVTVTNPSGIHARTAVLIAAMARRYDAEVILVKGAERGVATDVLQILSLATECGQQLVLEATGREAEAAVEALAGLVANSFSENEVK